MPLKISLKTHYSADYDRGIFDNRISNAPFSFVVNGGIFGNVTHPNDAYYIYIDTPGNITTKITASQGVFQRFATFVYNKLNNTFTYTNLI